MRLLLWLLVFLHLLGCGEGIFKDDSVEPTATEPAEEYRVPTITIKRLEGERIEERPAASGRDNYMATSCRPCSGERRNRSCKYSKC